MIARNIRPRQLGEPSRKKAISIDGEFPVMTTPVGDNIHPDVYREIKNLEDKLYLKFETVETMFHEIHGLDEKVMIKFDANDKAVKLLQDFTNRQPTTEAVNGDLQALKELMESKLHGIERLIEARFEANKEAISAALMSRKESSDKVEMNFTKQFDNITANLAILTKSFDGKIEEVKERTTIQSGRQAGMGAIGAIAVGVAGVVAVMIAFVNFILTRGPG